MGLLSPILFSILTLITLSVAASDDGDLTSNSVASFAQFQPAPNSANIANDPTSDEDAEENLVLSLARHASPQSGSGYEKKGYTHARTGSTHARTGSTHARTGSTYAKTGSGHAKTPSRRASYKKKPTRKTRSSGGVSVSTSSPGTLVIASSSNGKRCVTIKKPCGTTCSPDLKSIGMCSGVWKPKYCVKGKKLLVACPGKRGKMCTSTEKVSDTCVKTVKKKVRCPDKVGKRTVCSYPKVSVHSCKKFPPRCSKMLKKNCRYKKTSKKAPCRKPKRPCQECSKNTALNKCKTTITRKVEVPCGSNTSGPTASTSPHPSPAGTTPAGTTPAGTTPAGTNTRSGANNTSESPLPTPSSSSSASPFPEIEFFDDEGGYDGWSDESFNGFDNFDNDSYENDFGHEEEDSNFGDSGAAPVSFGNAPEHIKSVPCFASLFNEDDCKRAPDFCQLFDNAFDADKCTREVCRECEVIKNMHVGHKLRKYCRDLRGSCHFFSRMLVTRMLETATVARSGVEKSVETKKCYRNETKTVVLPCNYRLPESEVCIRGCRVGVCETIKKKRVSKYCRGHLPKHCYQQCSRKLVKRKVCHTVLQKKRSKKVCKKDKKVKYKCYKNKTVKKPCKGENGKLCSKLQKIKYVCGKVTSKFGKCRGVKGEKKCTMKMCVHKKCS